MLLNLREYHRLAVDGDRSGLERAVELLARPDVRTVPLAGGGALLAAADPALEAVVDLQGLGLDVMSQETDPRAHLRIGAMVTRAALAAGIENEHQTMPALAVAEGARRWAGSAQRNRATVGGALAQAATDDPLVVVLLACDAEVELFTRRGTQLVPLADFLPHRTELLAGPALITAVIVPQARHPNGAALAVVGRTPADAPIVVAAAALAFDGERITRVRLALGGVAAIPIRQPEIEALLAGRALTPALLAEVAARASVGDDVIGDYRGSADYRRAMAVVLAERALRSAWECAA